MKHRVLDEFQDVEISSISVQMEISSCNQQVS